MSRLYERQFYDRGDPELHDSRGLLRAGDSLIMFTDGVTEARRPIDGDLYGDDRLRDFIASLRDMPCKPDRRCHPASLAGLQRRKDQ
jgi:serine phosphatase RsbU (regulator of sigma subunit)